MDTVVQLQAYTGLGENDNEITAENSCLGKGTESEVWYIFTVAQTGDLCFTITQFDTLGDDYDWALFNITGRNCSDIINGDVTSFGSACNFGGNEQGCGGRTGANGENTGPCNEQNEACIPVLAGEVYVLNISTFVPVDQDVDGYLLDWTGSSAIIGDNSPPSLDFALQDCGNNTITVGFSENVVCQTVTPTDFSITGPDGNHVVTRIEKPACDQGVSTFADSFILEINPPITVSGQYTVSLTGEVLDICGFAAELPNSQTLNLSTLPAVVSASPQAICVGDSSTLQITGIGNAEQFDISWTPGNLTGASVTVTPDSTTTYNVTISDTAGCLLFNDIIEIAVLPRPTSTFTVTSDSLCTNQSGIITYTGEAPIGATFTWNFDGGQIVSGNAASPLEIQWDQAGIQTVTLSVESNGCVSDLTEIPVTVFQTPSTELTIPDQACEDSELTVLYSGNATPDADYEWGFNGGILLRQDTATGPGPFNLRYENDGLRTISLNITENGCSAQTSQEIVITPIPISEIAPEPDQCLNSNEYTFNYSGPNDNIESFNWDFGDGNGSTLETPTHSYNRSGTRIIQLGVLDVNGCLAIGTDTVEIFDEPTAEFTVEDGCIREKISFVNLSSTPPSSEIVRNEWAYGDGVESIQINPSHRYQNAGNFEVTLRVISEAGCTDTTSQRITINPNPDVGFEVQNVCLGDTTIFNDQTTIEPQTSSLVSWEWDFGDGTGRRNQDTVFKNYNSTGTYEVSLKVLSDNGCPDSITQSITIYPSNQPIMGIGDTVCFGESALLTVDDVATGSKVDWYNTNTSSLPFFTGQTLVTEPLLLNQQFFVESTSPQGCISARATVRANVIPRGLGEIVASDTIVEIPNAIVNFRLAGNIRGDEFNWSFGDGVQSTSDEPAHQYQYSGKYNINLRVIDINGCEYRFDEVVEVLKLVDLFAPSAFSPNGDGFNDEFFVISRLIRQFQIKVYNRWGKVVFESTDPDFRWDGSSMNGETLPEGVYVFLVKAQDIDGDVLEESGSVTIIR